MIPVQIQRAEGDVDLFVGGAAEDSLEDAWMGPTFACLTGLQFQRLKFGDRFFYEADLPDGFDEVQRDFIRSNTLAGLICELDEKKLLTRDVFSLVSENNPPIPCSIIAKDRDLETGLEHWRDANHQRETRRRFVSFDLSTPCDD